MSIALLRKVFYKYTYGETTSFDTIRKLRRQVAKDFKDAFIVAFKDGEESEILIVTEFILYTEKK